MTCFFIVFENSRFSIFARVYMNFQMAILRLFQVMFKRRFISERRMSVHLKTKLIEQMLLSRRIKQEALPSPVFLATSASFNGLRNGLEIAMRAA